MTLYHNLSPARAAIFHFPSQHTYPFLPKHFTFLPGTGKEWTPASLINPEELGDYFEGDIMLPLPPQGRNGIIDEKYRWPDGRVPYNIDYFMSE